MKPKERNIIFLNSYLPRTGHNFASEVLKVFVDHEVLPHNRSEIRISSVLEKYFEVQQEIRYKTEKNFLNYIFIEDLRNKILSQSSKKFVVIKNTTFVGVDKLPVVFPDDIHILLIRDPRRVFSSLFKAMDLNQKTWKNFAKRFGIYSGSYPYFYSRKLSNQVLRSIPDFKCHFILRFEDLVQKRESSLSALKNLFATEKSMEQIKQEIDAIPVINSSFYEELEADSIWDMKPKTSKFAPLSRKENNFMMRKGIEMGTIKLREKLGYN